MIEMEGQKYDQAEAYVHEKQLEGYCGHAEHCNRVENDCRWQMVQTTKTLYQQQGDLTLSCGHPTIPIMVSIIEMAVLEEKFDTLTADC